MVFRDQLEVIPAEIFAKYPELEGKLKSQFSFDSHKIEENKSA